MLAAFFMRGSGGDRSKLIRSRARSVAVNELREATSDCATVVNAACRISVANTKSRSFQRLATSEK